MTPATQPSSLQHLAIFGPSLAGGGAERAMINLAAGFLRRGLQVDLVLARAEGPYLSQVDPGVHLVDLGASRVATSLPALARYLRRRRPQGLIAMMGYAGLIAAGARRLSRARCPLAISEQVTPRLFELHTPPHFRYRARLLPPLMRLCYPWADVVAGVSAGTAADLARIARLPPEGVQVIHNPIITPDLAALKAQPADHPWLAPGQPPVVLAAGRLHQQKDFPTLLHAFARLRRQHRARLLILGEGHDRPLLEDLVAELGLSADVALPGFVANPFALMARGALFVLSSRWEGLPTVLVEALYCGLPVVATDCAGDGAREILDGGSHGALVPVADPVALADAMAAALTGSGPRPSPAAWQPYTVERVTARYLQALAAAAPPRG